MTETDLTELPPTLRQVAEACGLGVALQLAHTFGGVTVYVPKQPLARSPLVKAIGVVATEKMIKLFGHGHLEIPLGPTGNRRSVALAIAKNLREERSNAKTARAVGVHQRTVRRHRNRLDPGDLPLFDRTSKTR